MTNNTWPSTTPDRPCPKCGKPNRCRIAPDGRAGICWRSGSAEVWHDGQVTMPPRRRAVALPAKTFATPEAALADAGRWIKGNLVATWVYPGDVLRVGRWNLPDGSKSMRPIHCVANGWSVGDPSGPLPLYRGDALPPAGPVYVVEGEKCADIAAGIGLPAVASAHGSAAAGKTDWQPLAGRDVVILPDNDTPGRKYSADVVAILAALSPPARVKILNLPGLPPGGDIEQFDAAIGGTAEATRTAIEELATKTSWLESDGPILTCLADVQSKPLAWLWPGRIPLGRITLLVGRPGEGKSFFTIDAAARVTTGTPWPDGSPCPRGSVLLICGEDDPGDTIRPRLDAHRADCRQVHLLSMVQWRDEKGERHERMFTLEDVRAAEIALQKLPGCRLIIVDPIGSFLGGSTDAHRDNEVRGVLSPVAKLAEKYGPAVLIVAHRRKSGGGFADDTALGSRAFTGIARVVHHLSRDPNDKNRRLLLPGKNNLAREGDGLAFTIAGDPPAVCWEREPVCMSADDAMAAEQDGQRHGPEPAARNAAVDWLTNLLANGPVASGEPKNPAAGTIRAEAKAADLAWRTVRRAADQIGVLRQRERFTGVWQWRLSRGKVVGQVVGQHASNCGHLDNLDNKA